MIGSGAFPVPRVGATRHPPCPRRAHAIGPEEAGEEAREEGGGEASGEARRAQAREEEDREEEPHKAEARRSRAQGRGGFERARRGPEEEAGRFNAPQGEGRRERRGLAQEEAGRPGRAPPLTRRLVVLDGSPLPEGSVARMLAAAVSGAREAGGECETFRAYDLAVKPCVACGPDATSGYCIFHDDMDPVYAALERAHAVLVGSPVYFDR